MRVPAKSHAQVRFTLRSFTLFLENLALDLGFGQRCQCERCKSKYEKRGYTLQLCYRIPDSAYAAPLTDKNHLARDILSVTLSIELSVFALSFQKLDRKLNFPTIHLEYFSLFVKILFPQTQILLTHNYTILAHAYIWSFFMRRRESGDGSQKHFKRLFAFSNFMSIKNHGRLSGVILFIGTDSGLNIECCNHKFGSNLLLFLTDTFAAFSENYT